MSHNTNRKAMALESLVADTKKRQNKKAYVIRPPPQAQ